RLLPALLSEAVQRVWAGLRPATSDGRPILGRDPDVEGLWYATGHGRNGILLAALTGEIIADLLTTGATDVDIGPLGVDRFDRTRWRGYDLIRVGKPRRLELATWRYGERLRARRQEQLKFVVPMTVAAVGLAVAVNVAAGGSVGVFVWNTPRLVKRIYVEKVG